MSIEFDRYSGEVLLLPTIGLSYGGSVIELQIGRLWWGVIVGFDKGW